MSDKTLLASVALFRELYDNQKDIYDVISELIKASLIFSGKYQTDATSATWLIEEHFDLKIPEAVVNTALNQRLCKRDKIISRDGRGYVVSTDALEGSRRYIEDFNLLRERQDEFIENLEKYIEGRGVSLSSVQKKDLVTSVCSYFFDDQSRSKYSTEISGFIVQNKGNKDFTERLNAIREGFVLYDGVRHSPDVSQDGSWRNHLVVYFDTENLFSATGLNGDLHRQLTRDFLSLAAEARVSGKRLITVKYFAECLDEIERFFYAAQMIVEGKTSLDPSKPAMVSIVEGCSKKSDVLERKAKFLSDLERLGIEYCGLSIGDVDPRYNLDGRVLQEQLKGDLGPTYRDFNEEKCSDLLQMFTKINSLRRGKNSGPFEAIGHILVSEGFFSRYLAHYHGVVEKEGDITFSVDLEFITNRLWFRLHKGLGRHLAQPQTLNILAKAQVVLSSQINTAIYGEYDKLNRKFSSGEMRREEALYLLDDLKDKAKSPESIDENNVESVIEFLSHGDLTSMQRERSMLLARVEKGDKAVAKLAKLESDSRKRKIMLAKIISIFCIIILSVLAALILTELVKITLGLLVSKQDTRLSIYGFAITVLALILTVVNFKKIAFLMESIYLFLFYKARVFFGVDLDDSAEGG